jgi:hypothetical protein
MNLREIFGVHPDEDDDGGSELSVSPPRAPVSGIYQRAALGLGSPRPARGDDIQRYMLFAGRCAYEAEVARDPLDIDVDVDLSGLSHEKDE